MGSIQHTAFKLVIKAKTNIVVALIKLVLLKLVTFFEATAVAGAGNPKSSGSATAVQFVLYIVVLTST